MDDAVGGVIPVSSLPVTRFTALSGLQYVRTLGELLGAVGEQMAEEHCHTVQASLSVAAQKPCGYRSSQKMC